MSTRFDLADGAYSRAVATRVLWTATSLAAAAACGALVLTGMLAQNEAADHREEVAAAQTMTAGVQSQTAARSRVDGLSHRSAADLLLAYRGAVTAATKDQVSYTRLLTAVERATGSGVTVTGLTITVDNDSVDPGTPTRATPKTPASGTPAAGAAAGALGSVEVTGTADSYDGLFAYMKGVKTVSVFTDVETLYVGSGDTITFTTTASLTPVAVSNRQARLTKQMTVTLPLPAPGKPAAGTKPAKTTKTAQPTGPVTERSKP